MAKKSKSKNLTLGHSLKNFFKSRTLFAILALIFLAALSFTAISNLFFLGKQLNTALNVEVGASSGPKFDTAGFEQLKLIR